MHCVIPLESKFRPEMANEDQRVSRLLYPPDKAAIRRAMHKGPEWAVRDCHG